MKLSFKNFFSYECGLKELENIYDIIGISSQKAPITIDVFHTDQQDGVYLEFTINVKDGWISARVIKTLIDEYGLEGIYEK